MAFGSAGRSTTFAFIGEDKFSKTADHVSKKAGGMGAKIGKAGKVLAIGAGAAAAGVGLLAVGGLKAVKVAEEQATASARLSKVLDSMGYGKNAAAADKYADSIEQVIAVDSAEIKAGQAKLATFGDIAKSQKLMQRSTMLTADMAAAGFGSIGSNAVGLGKALQDPITGMSLLSKAGSLTKKEQKLIGDEFKRTGDKAKAQESILKALEKQVGGVAAETADASDKMSLGFGEITEEIGGALTPAFDGLVKVGLKVTDWIVKVAIPKAKEFGQRIMPKIRDVIDAVKKALKDNQPQMEKLGDILKNVAKFVTTKVIPAFLQWFKFILPKVVTAVGFVIDAITNITPTVLNVAKLFVKGFGMMFDSVVMLVDNGLKLIAKIPGPWQESMKAASASVSAFRDKAKEKFSDIEGGLESAAKKVADFNTRSKLKTDISDVKAKIATAKEKLNDPDLTKERKAAIKADIANLREGVRVSKAKLDEVKDRKVHITFSTTWTAAKVQDSWDAARKKASGRGGPVGSAAGARASRAVGNAMADRSNTPGQCLGQVSDWYGDAPGGVPHAKAAWALSSKKRYDANPPAGVPVYWGGGSYGHVALSLGGGMVRSTDWPSMGNVGTTSIGALSRSWNKPYYGWAADTWGKPLANGGIVKRRPGGMHAIIGEGAYDEAVVPLDGRHNSGGDTHLHFHNPVIGSKEDLARYVTDAQLDLKRRRGTDLGIA